MKSFEIEMERKFIFIMTGTDLGSDWDHGQKWKKKRKAYTKFAQPFAPHEIVQNLANFNENVYVVLCMCSAYACWQSIFSFLLLLPKTAKSRICGVKLRIYSWKRVGSHKIAFDELLKSNFSMHMSKLLHRCIFRLWRKISFSFYTQFMRNA